MNHRTADILILRYVNLERANQALPTNYDTGVFAFVISYRYLSNLIYNLLKLLSPDVVETLILFSLSNYVL